MKIADQNNSFIASYRRVHAHVGPLLFVLLGLSLLTGVTELAGIAMFVPLLTLASDTPAADNGLASTIESILSSIGLQADLATVCTIIACVFLAKGLLVFAHRTATGVIVERIKLRIRLGIVDDLRHSSYRQGIGTDVGFMTNVATTEVDKLASSTRVFILLLANSIWAMVFFAGIVSLAPYETLALCGAWVVVFVLSQWASRVSRRLSVQQSSIDAKLKNTLAQSISGYKYLKATGMYSRLRARTSDLISSLAAVVIRIVFVRESIQSLVEPLGIVLIIGLTYYRVSVLGFDIGETAALVMFIYKVFRYGSDVQVYWTSFNSAAGGLLTVDGFRRQMQEAREPDVPADIPSFEKNVSIRDIQLSIDSKPILRGVSMEIGKNSTIAIVGRSGSGKTTLVDLLIGLFDQDRGDVLFDDQETTAASRRGISTSVGYVVQDPLILGGTILDNITLFAAGDEAERIRREALEAAKLAECDFVSDDAGLDREIGDRGVTLSGGQRQRLAIAREIFRKPAFLILDEATSALDGATENAVRRSINRLHSRMTIVIIAHRLSTIKNADKVFVMDQGRIVESGTYQELSTAKGNVFSELFDSEDDVDNHNANKVNA